MAKASQWWASSFWAARASLAVQAVDIRPSLSTVERRFEAVKALLTQEGLIDPSRSRALPAQPKRIAVLTSVPSSALADILRTAKDRWPLTELLVVPIPVQGAVANKICHAIDQVTAAHQALKLDALVLARGGGSREDLMVFDDEQVCRALARCPYPVVTGLGHEDDLTVADLVADHRAATPTAAMVSLLPSKTTVLQALQQQSVRLQQQQIWRLKREQERLHQRSQMLSRLQPKTLLMQRRSQLNQREQLLLALSPDRWLNRGFAKVIRTDGSLLQSASQARPGDDLVVQVHDGLLEVSVATVKTSGSG